MSENNMKVSRNLAADFVGSNTYQFIYAVQGDSNTRELIISLKDNGRAWSAPVGISAAVAFKKPDGTRGLYDTLPDGKPAVTIVGDKVKAILAPQVLTVPGDVMASVVLFDKDLKRLSTFPFRVQVTEDPSAGKEVSNDYFNYTLTDAIQAAVAEMAAAGGLQELKGDIGPQGPQGEKGDKGDPGRSIGIFVTDYGAKGDGTTDDTTAFQTSLSKNRVVFVPGGTYKLSGELVIGDNCCLELSQDTVLEFTQTSGNCINLGLSSNLKGNHATVKVPYAFDGHVLHAYSNDRTSEDINAVPPWSRWDPQWKTGRYVSDLNICKVDNRGFHYCVNLGECKGTAVYISADNTVGLSTFMWGVHYTGLRIAGAFAYGIHAQNIDDGWLHEMRIDGFIDSCETGVCLEDCQNTYISAIIQPRRGYTEDKVYFPYAKYGIKLMRSKNTDLSGSRVWDWSNPDKPNTTENEKMTLYEEGNEYQHIAMYGDCQGTILNDYLYHSQGDTRNRIYTDTLSNLNTLTILQEPIDRWFKVRNGDPYYNTGSFDKKLITEEILAEHFTTDLVKNFTDILPEATDADGTVYGEIGYKNGYLSAQGSAIDSAYYCVTGFMPIKSGQTFYVNDMTFATYDGLCRISVYDANKNCIRSLGASGFVGGGNWHFGYTALPYGFSATINAVADNKDVAYVRFSVYKRNVGSYPMVSIDEPIKYTIEGFLADGVKVKGENVIGNVGETTPDWVATKKLEGGDIVYIPEQTLSSGMWKNLQMSLQPGLAYDVTFNGEVYACVARENGNGAILGNNSALTLNDYPFCIQWAGGTATSGMFFKSSDISYPVTLKVTDHAEYVYDKMPEGYLPNCAVKSVNGNKPDWYGNVEIEVPSGVDVTASVGQTIVVEEVDANGKPTKWKAAEYQERTHWTEETVILPETTVEIDPEAGMGLIPVDFTVEGGKKYTINYNGVDYADCECLELEGQILFGNLGAIDENMLVTEHPFVIAYTAVGEDNEGNSIFAWACVTLDGSTSVNLSITDVQHTPIPVEYVTNAFPCYIDATGSGTDDDPAIFNCNVNVLEAYKKGREIKLRRTLYDPLTVVYYNLVGASLVDNVERLEIWLFEFVYATPGSAHNAFLYVYVDRNGNIEKASD